MVCFWKKKLGCTLKDSQPPDLRGWEPVVKLHQWKAEVLSNGQARQPITIKKTNATQLLSHNFVNEIVFLFKMWNLVVASYSGVLTIMQIFVCLLLIISNFTLLIIYHVVFLFILFYLKPIFIAMKCMPYDMKFKGHIKLFFWWSMLRNNPTKPFPSTLQSSLSTSPFLPSVWG